MINTNCVCQITNNKFKSISGPSVDTKLLRKYTLVRQRHGKKWKLCSPYLLAKDLLVSTKLTEQNEYIAHADRMRNWGFFRGGGSSSDFLLFSGSKGPISTSTIPSSSSFWFTSSGFTTVVVGSSSVSVFFGADDEDDIFVVDFAQIDEVQSWGVDAPRLISSLVSTTVAQFATDSFAQVDDEYFQNCSECTKNRYDP